MYAIDVDASGDEGSASKPSSPAIYRPFRPRQESSDRSDEETKSSSSGLNFFFNVEKRSAEQSVTAARTAMCGQKFGRCELVFNEEYVELTICKGDKRIWRGQVQYAHLTRFCFARVEKPPFVLLMQLDERQGRSELATFYDSVFAKVCATNTKEQATPHVYGVVLFFDEQVDYMRCQSMADLNPRLAQLFAEQLTDSEVREYMKWDSYNRLRDRHPRREKVKSSVSSSAGLGRTFTEFARQTYGTVSDFFRPPSSVEGTKADGSTTSANTSPAQEEEKLKTISRKREATNQREEERVKRRKLESRRNEALLTYPYDDSDAAGRISVTLGDIDRLVPGEFLNDNIIDFYLRFLWRHLDPWQQEQTYFFTSHFFTQLNGTNGAHELASVDPDERFARVARWTKETDLFQKKFLFIPINDSFHWSIAVFCNPGSAIIKKQRTLKRRVHKHDVSDANNNVVDLVEGPAENGSNGGESREVGKVHNDDGILEDGDVEEEEIPDCQKERLRFPPCLLFLDSLRCHRKKKFTKMLRSYLECEWKARYSTGNATNQEALKDTHEVVELVTSFDPNSIALIEPNIPLQSNHSDCGVFLLMYALSIVKGFPAGVTRKELAEHLTPQLTPGMFNDEHVLEFREYLRQLLFCLQFLQKHGLPETRVREEGLEAFVIE